jgi:hypothetical protein
VASEPEQPLTAKAQSIRGSKSLKVGHKLIPVVRGLAGHRLSQTCVNVEFESTDQLVDAFGVKTIPIILYDGHELVVNVGVDTGRYMDYAVKFCLIGGSIPHAISSRGGSSLPIWLHC